MPNFEGNRETKNIGEHGKKKIFSTIFLNGVGWETGQFNPAEKMEQVVSPYESIIYQLVTKFS